MERFNVINASAGGAFLTAHAQATNQPQVLAGARLVAGDAADATAVIRETDGSGRILMVLAAGQGTADESCLPLLFRGNVHVTVTGADAVVLLFSA